MAMETEYKHFYFIRAKYANNKSEVEYAATKQNLVNILAPPSAK